MFGFNNKPKSPFGSISIDDDPSIDVQRLRKESRRGLWTEVFLLMRDILLVLTVMILFGVFVAQPVVVDGESMMPNLHNGERLLVNKLIYYKFPGLEPYGWTKLERGDIIVFWYPNDPDKSFVKRLIAFPGETVEMRNGTVLINGRELEEPYLNAQYTGRHENFAPKRVDVHHYFVMGDNRDNSSDSRVWGQVPEKYVYGKVFFRYWMPPNIGFIVRGQSNFKDEPPTTPAAVGDNKYVPPGTAPGTAAPGTTANDSEDFDTDTDTER
jgi:signal peptidase I